MNVLKLVLVLTFLTSSAQAHEWYDADCCSKLDCKPIDSCSEITEQSDGSAKWSKFTFLKKNVRPSRDSKCHVCIHMGTAMCVYMQQGS